MIQETQVNKYIKVQPMKPNIFKDVAGIALAWNK